MKRYVQHFRPQWLNDERYRGWLSAVPGNNLKSYCKLCQTTLTSRQNDIEKHRGTAKHQKAEELFGFEAQRLVKLTGEIINDEEIICAVMKRPPLYSNTDTPKYCDRYVQQRLWDECASELDSNVDALQTRWCHLREYFTNMYQSSESEAKKQKWNLYSIMSFLIPFVDEHLDIVADGDEDVDISLKAPNSRLDDTQAQFNGSGGGNSGAFEEELLKALKKREVVDSHEHYCMSLVPLMRLLDPVSAMECRINIQKVMLHHLRKTNISTPANMAPTHDN